MGSVANSYALFQSMLDCADFKVQERLMISFSGRHYPPCARFLLISEICYKIYRIVKLGE